MIGASVGLGNEVGEAGDMNHLLKQRHSACPTLTTACDCGSSAYEFAVTLDPAQAIVLLKHYLAEK